MNTKERISAVEKHLRDYESEGRTIRYELEGILTQRKAIEESKCLAVSPGSTGHAYGGGERAFFARGTPIVLGPEQDIDFLGDKAARGSKRAAEIAGPGLRACLLMWLNEWEAKVRAKLAAWEARDPIAEAVEKSKAAPTDAPAAPPAVA